MISVLLVLAVTSAVCALLWKRPAARAAASGAWRAGRTTAAADGKAAYRVVRGGYQAKRRELLDGNPSWKEPRRWLAAAMALLYGVGVAALSVTAFPLVGLAMLAHILVEAGKGAHQAHAEWKAAQPIDADVLDDQHVPWWERGRNAWKGWKSTFSGGIPTDPPVPPETPRTYEPPLPPDPPKPDPRPEPDLPSAPQPDPEHDPEHATTPQAPQPVADPSLERTSEMSFAPEFVSFPQLASDHSAHSTDLNGLAADCEALMASLASKSMGNSSMYGCLTKAMQAYRDLAVVHDEIVSLAEEQIVVIESHANVGGADNVADKDVYETA
ncbi:hypothetical protein ACIBH1_45710 [Nonomuraea sp. NPDC050663]|uniref:hypothetical protein n=1 Tax=Nonomuraea sp. NPDC050663 TaxID=3364370 RepID=UPI00379E4E16